MRRDSGQSLIEVVFAVGVIAIVMTGVASLMVYNLGSRTKSFDRKKATELGEKVIERLVFEERDQPVTFWDLSDRSSQSDADFPGYVYSVDFTNIADGTNCGVGRTDCAEVSVMIGWSGVQNQSVEFNRFFSRK